MTRTVKYLSATVAVLLLLLLIAIPSLGEAGWSDFLGHDIRNIVVEGTGKIYNFSLIDRLPIVLLVGLILCISCGFIFLKTESVAALTKSSFLFIRQYIIDSYNIIKRSNVKYFLLLSFATTLYLALCYPLTLDEPMTYYDFIKPPFWHAVALYPYPNNHVFATLLVNLTNEIPGLDLLFRLRLPAIFTSLLTWIFAYRFVKKFYSENVALFVISVGTIVVTNIQHAYIARGYAFVMLFTVIGLYSAFNIIRHNNRRRDWLAFAISSALGAWTMPSYLYPFLSISIFIFIYNYKAIKLQILYSALVGILVFLMYSPILLVSGVEALTSNEFVQTVDRLTVIRSLPGFMLGTVVHIFYLPYYLIMALFLIIISYTLWRREKNTLILWVVFAITPCLFLTLHAVIPFFRTFFYYGFIFIFLFGVSFSDLLSKIELKKMTLGLLCVHVLGIIFFIKISRELMPEVFQSNDVITEILEDDKKYYMDSGISWLQMMNLQFEAERKGYDINIEAGSETDIEKLPYFDYYLIKEKTNATTKEMDSKKMLGIFNTSIKIYSQPLLRKNAPIQKEANQ